MQLVNRLERGFRIAGHADDFETRVAEQHLEGGPDLLHVVLGLTAHGDGLAQQKGAVEQFAGAGIDLGLPGHPDPDAGGLEQVLRVNVDDAVEALNPAGRRKGKTIVRVRP